MSKLPFAVRCIALGSVTAKGEPDAKQTNTKMNIPDALQILALSFPGTVREITSQHVLDADDNLSSQWAVSIVARNGVTVDDALADNLGDAVRAVHGRLQQRRDALEAAFSAMAAGGKVEAKLPPHTVEAVQ